MNVTRRDVFGSALGLAVTMSPLARVSTSTAIALADPQDGSAAAVPRDRLLAAANATKQELKTVLYQAQSEVTPVAEPSAFLRWKMKTVGSVKALSSRLIKSGDTVYVDFGRHLVGYLSFQLDVVGRNVDSPARLRLTFGEVPGDVAEPLYPSKGDLPASWLPDEVVNLDPLPRSFRMDRRHAFRYLRIDVMAMSQQYSLRLSKIEAQTVSSAVREPTPLSPEYGPLAREIDRAAIQTLHDCMQTVFEDGPRRDQRLWTGDLRLEALSNSVTFRNFDLVRHCLYLLAAFPQDDGMLTADVYEKPAPKRAGDVISDYALLYTAIVREYLDATGDLATCRDLWPTVTRQFEIAATHVNPEGLYVDPKTAWIFIDWEPALQRDASMQGVIVFSLRHAAYLAGKLGDRQRQAAYQATIEKMCAAARAHFYDGKLNLFVSGPERQISWSSQAWLSLAGMLPAKETASVLRTATTHRDILMPGTPYGYHYIVEAMVTSGLNEEAENVIAAYWGGMVQRGADTFWEAYNPSNSTASPYGDVHLNSFCHGWSATPTYFFRKHGLGKSEIFGR